MFQKIRLVNKKLIKVHRLYVLFQFKSRLFLLLSLRILPLSLFSLRFNLNDIIFKYFIKELFYLNYLIISSLSYNWLLSLTVSILLWNMYRSTHIHLYRLNRIIITDPISKRVKCLLLAMLFYNVVNTCE